MISNTNKKRELDKTFTLNKTQRTELQFRMNCHQSLTYYAPKYADNPKRTEKTTLPRPLSAEPIESRTCEALS